MHLHLRHYLAANNVDHKQTRNVVKPDPFPSERRGGAGDAVAGMAHKSAAHALEMACIEDTDGFRALRDEWDALHAICREATPFNSWEWLCSWWQVYGGARSLRVLVWRLDGALVGIAPLYVARETGAFGLTVTVLRMVGDGSADSDYLSFLMRDDLSALLLDQFAAWLAAERGCHALVLRDLPEASTLLTGLLAATGKYGLLLRKEYGRCAAIQLPDVFEELLLSLRPRFRTKVRSLLKRLAESQLTFESAVSAEDLKRRLRSLFELHQARWRSAGGVGVFERKAKRRFYALFATRFARKGWLRLYSLRRGDTYVAHQLCFSANGTTYLLQEGFDVSNPASSYGQMLRACVLRHLIERRQRRYDFLGGYSRHKEDWGATEAKTVHVTVAQKSVRGTFYLKLPKWRDQTVEIAKRVLPRAVVQSLKQAAGRGG